MFFLDVALGLPHRALPWLRAAYGKKADNSEIVASYVHALAGAGRTAEARGILERALVRFDSRELEALLRWLDQGAPSRAAGSTRTVTAFEEPAASGSRAAENAGANDRKLARVLARGLAHLPLDARQRNRALVLARDVLADAARLEAAAVATAEAAASAELVANAVASAKGVKKPARKKLVAKRAAPACAPTVKRGSEDLVGLAAAVAYAIVYVDLLPLSQAEVAAPFRVAVGRLRGRFAELRAKLDIIPGDARYATTRG